MTPDGRPTTRPTAFATLPDPLRVGGWVSDHYSYGDPSPKPDDDTPRYTKTELDEAIGLALLRVIDGMDRYGLGHLTFYIEEVARELRVPVPESAGRW